MTSVTEQAFVSRPGDERQRAQMQDASRQLSLWPDGVASASVKSVPQLPLGFAYKDIHTFDTFIPGENRGAMECLQAVAQGRSHGNIYLWGARGVGKSHLLLAACRLATQAERSCAYLPLNLLDDLTPDMFASLENLCLVCLDDTERVAGRHNWECALFDLFNRLRETDTPIVMSAGHSPDASAIRLADLKSRLSWDLAFRIQPPDEAMKIALLERRAQARGLVLSKDVTDYLMRRVNRDTLNLLRWLDRLDTHSLATQRRLTVPLVRQVLEQGQ